MSARRFVSEAGQSDQETEQSLAAMYPEVADDYRDARRIQRFAEILTLCEAS